MFRIEADDILTTVFEFLAFDGVTTVSTVCSHWHAVVTSSAQLNSRRDVMKAVAIFNTKAQMGLDFVLLSGMASADPSSLLSWLVATEKHLDKFQLGELLGAKQCKPLLREYMGRLDFSQNHLDEGLRAMLSTVSSPGTTSGMRRILKAFARRFCECNPNYFAMEAEESSETAYLLCFAMLTLSTDAHSTNVERKMTRQQFVAYTLSIAPSLSLRYLEGLYDRITQREIQKQRKGIWDGIMQKFRR
eukprot:TRINITY_DN94156_c0_g1_i1.p1 TRINITY_DN94156_c0_g1~~TRINITY_DN94156_c0_g1_i1.p1  ORF type:complete len:246 (+),score=39.08 TRINITY_DN94156_c0_g1_i1:519-1256(+)